MEDYIIFIFGTIISCLINTVIVFQIIEERNDRMYHNNLFYFLMKAGVFVFVVCVNWLNRPFLNIIIWMLSLILVNLTLYENKNKKSIYRIIEVIMSILILTICETAGVELLDYIFWKLGIQEVQPIMLESMEMTFSKLFVLIFYYLIIIKVWKNDSNVKFTRTQCLIELIIIGFSIANLAVIISVITKVTSKTERILILVNMGCILLADLYFLYFARFVEENNQLKVKLKLLEQQSVLQYEFYEEQEEKYLESVKIFHDVDKHLRMIESMYQSKEDELAITYTQKISQMLMPLSLEEFTNNPILNVILNDKRKIANLHSIDFRLEIGAVDLSFMEPIEVTTVFGNLLDNAIEACDLVPANRFIEMRLDKYNDFIVVNLCNSTSPIGQWCAGKPVSRKGKNHGIGLMNVEQVIKKYNGSMVLGEENKIFSCKIIFSL